MTNQKLEKNLSKSIYLINTITEGPKQLKEKKYDWQEISNAMMEITRKHTLQSEEILVKLLDFDGTIQLTPESPLPGVLSPENMLKYNAITYLTEWTGRKYIKELKKVNKTTDSPRLSKITREYIKKLER